MAVHVPHDVLLNHILPRVPPKSIGRFRCVSKEWRSLLTSSMFETMYIHNHQNNIELLLFSKTETSSSFKFTIINPEAPPTDKGLTPTRHPLPQFGDTTPPLDIHILTSFHGLVCLGIIKDWCGDRYSDLILWNPLTNEHKRLYKSSDIYCKPITVYSKLGLYYSSCEDDDYKLLLVNCYVYVYSLKSDSWRKVDHIQREDIIDYQDLWSLGTTYLNENLYFLKNHENTRRLISVIRFDTKTERLSTIGTLNVYESPYVYNYSATIVVKSDFIHVCVKYDDIDDGSGSTTCIKLWKLDEYDKLKEGLTYQLRPHVSDIHISSLSPFYLMKNGNWLMMKYKNKYQWRAYENKMYKVDLEKSNDNEYEYAEEVIVDGDTNILTEEGRYIETFVSPNRYMK